MESEVVVAEDAEEPVIQMVFLDRQTRVEDDIAIGLQAIDKAEGLFAQKRRLMPRFREMTESGLGSGAATAESRLLNALRDWAQEADLTVYRVPGSFEVPLVAKKIANAKAADLRVEDLCFAGKVDEALFILMLTNPLPAITGRSFESEWAMAWTVINGKVTSFQAYEDTARLVEAFRK